MRLDHSSMSAVSSRTTRSTMMHVAGWMTLAAVITTAVNAGAHPASALPVFTFHGVCILIAALIVPRPRSHAYSALAVMLLLGFWTKFVVRLVADVPYLEPIGRFDHSTAAWDRALWAVSAGLAGLAAARVLHLVVPRRDATFDDIRIPPAYLRFRRPVWIGTAVVVVLAYAWNRYASVYVTGVNPAVVLPASGNAVLAWSYMIGIPIWCAILLEWERQRRLDRLMGFPLLWVPIVEALLNAASTLSRAGYLLRLVPYLIANGGVERSADRRTSMPTVRTVGVILAGFALSLPMVMVLRVGIYFQPQADAGLTVAETPSTPSAPATAPAPADEPPEPGFMTRPVFFAVREIGTLFLDRWTGMEGVLAITAADPRPSLLVEAIAEDPTRGTHALYQRLAATPYQESPRFTFLTLAGVIGVLAMAGSPVVVFLGMMLVGSAFVGTESFARFTTKNDVVCALVGVIGAFMVAQVTFPRLLLIFFVELWIGLALLGALLWWLTRQDAVSDAARSLNLPRAEGRPGSRL